MAQDLAAPVLAQCLVHLGGVVLGREHGRGPGQRQHVMEPVHRLTGVHRAERRTATQDGEQRDRQGDGAVGAHPDDVLAPDASRPEVFGEPLDGVPHLAVGQLVCVVRQRSRLGRRPDGGAHQLVQRRRVVVGHPRAGFVAVGAHERLLAASAGSTRKSAR